MDIYRNQERELKLAKKPLIVLEDELWQINQLNRLRKDLRNRKKRLEKVIAVKRLLFTEQFKRRLRERWRMKRNNIEEMHKQMFILVNLLKKDGHDPLAIAGCMLAGAVQIYQTELGEDTAFQLLDQIANGSDDDYDFDESVDKETIH